MEETKPTAAQRKVIAELDASYYLSEQDSYRWVKVYRHQDDERHVVVDTRLTKIVKRFPNGESSWSKAARFATDYYWAHREADEWY